MRRDIVIVAGVATTAALLGCGAEQQAQRQINAAIRDLDSEILADAEGVASHTGDGPFPDPRVSQFEVTLVEGADLEEAGAQLNMLRDDHDISPDVHIDEDTLLWTESAFDEAPELTDQQWAGILGLTIEENLTSAALFDADDADGVQMVLHYESEEYEEAAEAFLSWQDLEAPDGVSQFEGTIETGGPGADTFPYAPHIQLGAPIGEGQILPQVVEDAHEYQGWHDVNMLELRRAGDGGTQLELGIRPDAEGLSNNAYREQLIDDTELFTVAEDFADHVERTLDQQGEMDTLITIGHGGVDLAERGSYTDDTTPQERNASIVESEDN